MSRCEHPVVFASFWLAGEWVKLLGDSVEADRRVCSRCREPLPLGPANDTPETAVEVRAAELAQARGEGEPPGWWGMDARDGWVAYAIGDRAPDDENPWGQAGWLAAAIYNHKESDRG